VAYGIKNGSGVYAPFNNETAAFKYGRGSNPLGPFMDDVEAAFPKGHGSWGANMEAVSIGLKGVINEAELVALLGTHVSG